jgi:tetratricopeptide (TPR) repeat protein
MCRPRKLQAMLFSGLQGQAWALNHLGVGQQLTEDYPAATASLTLALQLFGDLGERAGQAEASINLGELLSQSSEYREACSNFTQALSIARDIDAPVLEARALEGIGQSQIREGNPGEGAEHLQ